MRKSRKDCSNTGVVVNSVVVENSNSEDLDSFPDSRKNARHPKSLKDRSYREKEIKVVRSICKELSGKDFQSELNQFQPSNGLLNRRVICRVDQVSLKFASPLHGISDPSYIKKWKCEDMIGISGGSEDIPNPKNNTSPSVIAVGLNWRKGVKVEQVSIYSRQSKLIEPELTRTDFDFESKLKFTKQLQSVISDLFPSNNSNGDVKVLDGNECHGRVTIKSKEIQPEGYNPNSSTTATTTSGDVYEDKEEHKILLVPFHSKSGFDTDVSKRYSFPYHAKFTIDKKNYEHQFLLRLIPSQSPQHFGLIFSFPNNDQGGIITVKSLFSVHSVFPSTSKHAFLVTYTNNSESSNINDKKKKEGGYKGQFVKNLKETVSANLEKEKLVNGSAFNDWDRPNEFSIGSSIAHPHQRFLGIPKPYSDRESKQKMKASIVNRIRREESDNGPLVDCGCETDMYLGSLI